MLLTSVQQREAARKAIWMLDIYMGRNTADSAVFTGEGVLDLDRSIALVQGPSLQPGSRIQIDLGGQSSDWRNCDVEDLQAIRAYYVQFYGEVERPNVWDQDAEKALAL